MVSISSSWPHFIYIAAMSLIIISLFWLLDLRDDSSFSSYSSVILVSHGQILSAQMEIISAALQGSGVVHVFKKKSKSPMVGECKFVHTIQQRYHCHPQT